MIGSADVLSDVQVFAEFPHSGGCKSGVAVGDDLLGEAVVGEHMFAVEFSNSYGIDCFSAWDEYRPFWHFECGFPFVAFFNLDIIVSPLYIEFGEERSTLELFQDRFNQGEWVVIADCLFVQFSVVLDRSELSILLFNEEKGGRVWGFRFLDVPLAEVFS